MLRVPGYCILLLNKRYHLLQTLLKLKVLAHTHGGYFMSSRKMAETLNLTEFTYFSHLRKLLKLGLIKNTTWKVKGGKKYFVTPYKELVQQHPDCWYSIKSFEFTFEQILDCDTAEFKGVVASQFMRLLAVQQEGGRRKALLWESLLQNGLRPYKYIIKNNIKVKVYATKDEIEWLISQFKENKAFSEEEATILNKFFTDEWKTEYQGEEISISSTDISPYIQHIHVPQASQTSGEKALELLEKTFIDAPQKESKKVGYKEIKGAYLRKLAGAIRDFKPHYESFLDICTPKGETDPNLVFRFYYWNGVQVVFEKFPLGYGRSDVFTPIKKSDLPKLGKKGMYKVFHNLLARVTNFQSSYMFRTMSKKESLEEKSIPNAVLRASILGREDSIIETIWNEKKRREKGARCHLPFWNLLCTWHNLAKDRGVMKEAMKSAKADKNQEKVKVVKSPQLQDIEMDKDFVFEGRYTAKLTGIKSLQDLRLFKHLVEQDIKAFKEDKTKMKGQVLSKIDYWETTTFRNLQISSTSFAKVIGTARSTADKYLGKAEDLSLISVKPTVTVIGEYSAQACVELNNAHENKTAANSGKYIRMSKERLKQYIDRGARVKYLDLLLKEQTDLETFLNTPVKSGETHLLVFNGCKIYSMCERKVKTNLPGTGKSDFRIYKCEKDGKTEYLIDLENFEELESLEAGTKAEPDGLSQTGKELFPNLPGN